MVKNEADVIQATLQPFLDAGIDSFLILDTGSTDNTISLIRKIFDDYNIGHGYIVEQPFVDFATSRNYALQCAEEQFPTAHFFLMPDAEWYMNNVSGLLEFCRNMLSAEHNSYLIQMRNSDDSFRFAQQRLLRAHKGLRFVGVVHETPNQGTSMHVS